MLLGTAAGSNSGTFARRAGGVRRNSGLPVIEDQFVKNMPVHFAPVNFGVVGRGPCGQRIAIVAERSTRVGYPACFSLQPGDGCSRLRGKHWFDALQRRG